ncbi:MAG: hypothetical protein UX31_C0003G0055 [Candidatus Nomurabacteria bacterium GW2011_GWA1_46_11]|uniref:Membrane-bound metal-dependent hydrolase n=1 Tax=Candidatus Nomurabacteria bacterium GW2011_GWA1_46_11 TaxID=1618732 RepID=A0A0G1NP00_9BACT|nr:MAG: hypothetical protein UW69_C0072G0004 [Microgenomates group bacterium GW2011_GWA2_44_7]KKT78329.1 MAG: hypothetical protein UW73_C0004G0053 [Microgenomates group bacterium GW2011_GWB1_44_8]KKU22389.1 MAG: hypothetical protein UX31_C0003G0055 [Candidatus Nomurabacteria bacterium GW2011_GWA1_46_11]
MTTVTHLTSGLVIAKVVNSFFSQPLQPEHVIVISAAFALLPDVNLLWHRKLKSHHDDFTHYPAAWIAISGILFIASSFLGLLLFVNTMLHLILDTFGFTIGVKLLAPFNKREYSFTNLERDKADWSLKEKCRFLLKNPGRLNMELGINLLFISFLIFF